MISILNKSSFTKATVLVGAALLLSQCFFATQVLAQGSQSLSVAPTLFEMTAVPGQSWQSSIRVINTNPFPLTVYLQVVNFAPQGEGGTGKFIPVFEDFTEGKTLAEWITFPELEVTIPPQKTQGVPFTLEVPHDVSPGGHFAAILVGTRPGDDEGTNKFQVRTAQFVTSLFFLRVAGDVVEKGSIREFRVSERLLTKPEVSFELRFENNGNVHLQPQGEIMIYNMWGKERGVVPINHRTHFGNVLPDSIRKFNFSWEGEWSLSEIGRYSALVTLGYGDDGKKFVSSKTYFWVVPIKEILMIVGALIAVILFMVWVIRLYVRKMLKVAGVDPGAVRPVGMGPQAYDPDAVMVSRYEAVSGPVRAGARDLKDRLQGVTRLWDRLITLFDFVKSYRLFFLSLIVVLISIFAIVWYINDARTDKRSYEVTIENPDQTVTLSSEEVIYDELTKQPATVTDALNNISTTSPTVITIINQSGFSGAGAQKRILLEDQGFTVGELKVDLGDVRERTVIVYNADLSELALELSTLLDGALLSARPEVDQNEPIIIYLGEDEIETSQSLE